MPRAILWRRRAPARPIRLRRGAVFLRRASGTMLSSLRRLLAHGADNVIRQFHRLDNAGIDEPEPPDWM